jgi:eukaryotic-like serine/threonine-protein kinase
MTSSPPSRHPTIPEFWKLVAQSELYTSDQCRDLHVRFNQEATPAPASGVKLLAKWLIERKYLTLYQAQVLLAGRPGPFLYGDFKLLERLEEGALAGCFRAVHRSTRYPVWLQFLAGDALQQPTAWAQLTGQLTALCSLNAPHVQRWFTWVDLGQFKFLVSEELAGETFSELLRRGPLPPSRACWLAQQVARGVQTLHELGWSHGQLNLETLWCTPSQTAKVLLHPLTSVTALKSLDPLVRADYEAPELALPGQALHHQADIYALGCILYQLLSGRPPVVGDTPAEKQRQHASQPIPSLQRYRVHPELEQAIARLMAKNPSARCPTMSEAVTLLDAFVGDEPHLMPPSLPDRNREAFEHSLPPLPAPASPAGGTDAAHPKAFPGPIQPVIVTDRPKISRGRKKTVSRPVIRPPASPPGPSMSPSAANSPTPHGAVVSPSSPPPTPPNFAQPAPRPSQPPARPAAAPAALQQLAEVARESARPVSHRRSSWSRRQRLVGWIGGGIGLLLLLLAASSLFFGAFGTGTAPRDVAEAPDGSSLRATTSADNSASATRPPAPIADDGVSLWASPTQGAPLDLRGVPPESLLTVVLRPAEILQHPEGPRVIRALGPVWEQWVASLRQTTGIPLEEMERLVMTLHDREPGLPRAAYTIRLVEPKRRSELLELWGQPSSSQGGTGESVYVAGDWGYYCWESKSAAGKQSSGAADTNSSVSSSPPQSPEAVGPDDWIRSFVSGPLPEIEQVAEVQAAPPLPHARTKTLLQSSDGRRMANVFFVPQFWRSNLLRDGRQYYFGETRGPRLLLDWLVGEKQRAGILSLHLGEGVSFAEVKLLSDEYDARLRLAADLAARIRQLPDIAERYLAREMQPLEYWRIVAFRYPLMLQFLADHTRVQVEDDLIVMNAILPSAAVHNLFLASELLLASSSGARPVEAPAAATAPPTLEALLEERISLRFDQLALEAALESIVSDIRDNYPNLPFEFDIKIVGDDFEKGGITRNQQIVNFDQRNATVGDVLTAIVRMANPITTVRAPHEPDQKLIWVVAPEPTPPARTIVLLTTRDGAAERGWTLPAVFRTPN